MQLKKQNSKAINFIQKVVESSSYLSYGFSVLLLTRNFQNWAPRRVLASFNNIVYKYYFFDHEIFFTCFSPKTPSVPIMCAHAVPATSHTLWWHWPALLFESNVTFLYRFSIYNFSSVLVRRILRNYRYSTKYSAFCTIIRSR